MPNWCKNRLSVCGPPEEVARFVKAARGSYPLYDESNLPEDWRTRERPVEPLCFHALVPVPDAILAGPYSVGLQHDAGGYGWQNRHWGCKWGASEGKLVGHTPGRATYTFQTPWGPGLAFHDTVARDWPLLTFYLSYAEEYPSRGRIVWRQGKRLKEIEGRRVREELPKSLNVKSSDADNEALWARQDAWEKHYVATHERWVDEKEPKRVRAS